MTDATELRVTFNEAAIRAYGGPSGGFHASAETARERGYDGLVSWGSLTLLPFWELMERAAGPGWQIGATLSVRLAKPVLAGDEVVYVALPQRGEGDTRLFELSATTARNGIVAKGHAAIGSAGGGS